MNDVARCPLCQSGGLKTLKEYLFRFPGSDVENHLTDTSFTRLWILFERVRHSREPAKFRTELCPECGFIFSNPRFTVGEMKTKYDILIELGSVKKTIEAFPSQRVPERAERIFHLVEKHQPRRAGKLRILDYGGASGHNLVPFTHQHDCFVLDYEQWKLPQGVTYLGNDLDDLKSGERFDVILFLHTLEHVIDPAEVVREMSSHLTDDGILYVEVPLGAWREWGTLREPMTHVNFWSEQSLLRCFRDAGLQTIHLSSSYQWVTHNNGWCLNIIGTKDAADRPIVARSKSTAQQMASKQYYLPYFFNIPVLKGYIRRIVKR